MNESLLRELVPAVIGVLVRRGADFGTAYLHERAGDLEHAAELYAEASRAATSVPERDHLTRRPHGCGNCCGRADERGNPACQ